MPTASQLNNGRLPRATEEEKEQVAQLKNYILDLMLRLGKDDLLDVLEEAEEQIEK